MIKVVITGDTHLSDEGQKLPDRLLQECENADFIIHTGDWKSLDVMHALSTFSEVIGVYGNVDEEEIRSCVPERQTIDIGGFRIGIIHGHGTKKTTEQRAIVAFADQQVDAIVFGHSHIPIIRYFKRTLLINPGSPTYKRKLPFYSFILLEIDDEIRPELILFRDKS